jgi:hypothetical protein
MFVQKQATNGCKLVARELPVRPWRSCNKTFLKIRIDGNLNLCPPTPLEGRRPWVWRRGKTNAFVSTMRVRGNSRLRQHAADRFLNRRPRISRSKTSTGMDIVPQRLEIPHFADGSAVPARQISRT